MKQLILIIFLSMALVACGGSTDNSEPPAVLTNFKRTLEILVAEDIEYNGEASMYTRIEPLTLHDKIIFSDHKGLITAIESANLTTLWEVSLGDNIKVATISGNNQSIVIGTRAGQVYLLNTLTGQQQWVVRSSSEVISNPVITSNLIIIKSVDGQLTALDSKTGATKWLYKKDVPSLTVRGNSSPTIIDNKIITGLDNGKLIILDLQSGQLLWEKTITLPKGRSETERLVDLDADIIIDNTILYIAGYQGKLVALDLRTGDFLWSKNMSVVKNMTLDKNRLYVTDVLSHVWSIDTVTGATVWKQTSFTARKLTMPVSMNDYLLLADFKGYLHIIAKSDGHHISRVQVDESGINLNPIVINDKILVKTRNAKLYPLSLLKKNN